jgi:ankyrin repeat protein
MEQLVGAIEAGDESRTRSVAEAEPDLATTPGPGGITPLMLAIYRGRGDLARTMIEAGVQPDIFAAAALGDQDLVGDIISARPQSMEEFSEDGWTALHLAGHFGNLEAAQTLVEAGADVRAVSNNAMANQPLHAALAGRSTPVARLLVEQGADVNARQHGGFTPLQAAAQNGDLEALQLLLDAGADPEAATDDGRTALSMAQEAGHDAVVAVLREAGAS